MATTDKMDLSYEVARRVQIEDVHILRSTISRSPSLSRLAKIEVAFSVVPELLRDAGKLKFVVSFRLHGRGEGQKSGERNGPGLAIDTAYVVTYRLSSADSLEHDHLQAFGEMNGVYNTWPFWREFVQSATARMGLPGLTIPVLPPMAKQLSTLRPNAPSRADY